ncbi:MAG: hypothetical protein NW205_13640 [Hyphomicrobiaceae bacterium]|nr:hypothetical protein [Hyphomicrobiaceae bacterium]
MLTQRFRLLAMLFATVAVVSPGAGFTVMGGVGDVFVAFAVLLVLTVIMLWPGSVGDEDRAVRQAAGGSWAERIDIEAIASQYAKGEAR